MIDAHAHLQSEAFANDVDEVLGRAVKAGVDRVLVPGWNLESSEAAVALARRASVGGLQLTAAAGVHPHDAASADGAVWGAIEELAADESVVAVGETGLDYDRMFSPRDAQLANLRRHLALARRIGKPLILHCRSAGEQRDAQDDLLRELEEAGVGGPEWHAASGDRPPGVLHSYSGPIDYGERALELGLAVSFSGLVFRAGQMASEVIARRALDDRVLVETDAPFLPPRGAPRRRNEPAFVSLTADWLADQRGRDTASLERELAASFDRIFGVGRAMSDEA